MANKKFLTLEIKNKIIIEINSGTSNSDIFKKYDLSSSTVSTIWKNKDKTIKTLTSNASKLKRIRKSDNKNVDKALLQRFKKKSPKCAHK